MLPKMIIHRIDSLIANFWWGQQQEEKRIHWKAWIVVCGHKDLGGIGFRDFECFNAALLAKQGWRLIQAPNSVLSLCLRMRYFPRSSFLEAKMGFRPSAVWRGLWKGGRYLWMVSNGRLEMGIWSRWEGTPGWENGDD